MSHHGAGNPCAKCGMSHRNTVHTNEGQFGFHQHVQQEDDAGTQPAGERDPNHIWIAGIERGRAIGRLEEFLYVIDNQPLDPTYWNKHEEERLREELRALPSPNVAAQPADGALRDRLEEDIGLVLSSWAAQGYLSYDAEGYMAMRSILAQIALRALAAQRQEKPRGEGNS